MRLAILGSTRGSNLEPIITAINTNELDAEIVVVLSNKANTGILERAQSHGLTTLHIPATKGQTREDYDRQVDAVLKQYRPDLIVMIGYMRIVSPWFTQQWQDQIINVHPSLLPKHAGLMDLQAHEAVLAAGESETGCTVHIVNEVVDGGRILVQETCTVVPGDTPESLKSKVQALEGKALINAIKNINKH